MPMIGFMAHPYMLHGTLYMGAICWPRVGHGFYQAIQSLVSRICTGLGEALQQALVGYADNACIYRMVAVVVAVFFVV